MPEGLAGGLLATASGSVAGCLLGCLPGFHIYGAGAAACVVFAASGCLSTPEVVPFATAALTSWSIVNALPAILLTAPDESATLIVQPSQVFCREGRGREAILLTAAGALCALPVLVAALPAATPLLAAMHNLLRPHYHWILWCLIVWLLMSEWPRARPIGPGGWRKVLAGWTGVGAGLATFVLSGFLGIILFHRPPVPASAAFQNLMPAFVGLFAVPGLILSCLSRARLPPQRERPVWGMEARVLLRGVGSGLLGGLVAAAVPAVTGGVGGLLAGHATGTRDERVFLVAQGACKAVYYIAGLLVFLLPQLGWTRGGAVWLLRPLVRDTGLAVFLSAAGAALIGAAFAFLALDGLSRLIARHAARLNLRLIAAASLALSVALTTALTGPWGLAITTVAAGIGLIPLVFGSRRLNALGVILLPVAINMSGWSPQVNSWLRLA